MKIFKKQNVRIIFGDKSLHNQQIKQLKRELKINRIVFPKQIHSAAVKTIENSETNYLSSLKNYKVDALITKLPNIFLGIKTADCVPILLFDESQDIIAAIHSGRKGTQMHIARKTVLKMINKYDVEPPNLKIFLGPAITTKHYPVDKQTFHEFEQSTQTPQNFPHINIKKEITNDFLDLGVKKNNIENIDICTYENKNYFSYRKSKTNKRQISLIGILK